MSILAELEPGALFAGDFRVVRKLSAGGMGAIYLAEQVSTGRQRALKLMHPGLVGSPELRQKFALEARVGGRVASEHIVEVVAAGVDGEVPWLAMELLVGRDLAGFIAHRGPIPKEEVVAILGQVCHGLAAAHAAGIVHRDLKPENIFLAEARRANESFTVKLLDFGIAKVVEAARGSNTGAIGSPLWMAPEQTERHAEIGPSTDVWALGLVAFHMLTGKVFWLAVDQGELALTAFLRELVLDPIPSASERAAQLGAAGKIPVGFDAWFGRCVVRERERRFTNADEAYAALGRSMNVFVTGPQQALRISTGGSGAAQPDEALGQARTQVDDSRPHVSEEELARAVVPIQGLSPAAFTALAVVAAVVIVVGALFLIGRRSGAAAPLPASSSSSSSASPVPFCAKGMVRVAGGELAMGSNAGPTEEQPEHPVTVTSFCLDATEVTAGEFMECTKKGGCAPPQLTVDWVGIAREEREQFSAYCNYGKEGRRDHPMNCIAFDEAAAFCKWAGKRLPTEEQWEYAARGHEGRAFPWGHEPPGPRRMNGCDHGCARAARRPVETLGPRLEGDDGWEATASVGSYPEGVSVFGAFDMAGNVAEWVDAPFCPYGQSACGTASRVVRGGSWSTDAPVSMRATARAKANPAARHSDVGLRCVR